MPNNDNSSAFCFPYSNVPPENCTCGRKHVKAPTEIVYGDAVSALSEIILINGFTEVLLIADKNTYPLAGERLMGVSCNISSFIYDKEHLVPNEKAVGELLLKTDNLSKNSGKQLLVALGSGTLNDLTRYISYRLRIPYIIIATAPSMDGYASNVSPLIVSGIKTTYEAVVPQYIICDAELLKTAPDILISAGVGDAMKYSCLCDWRLSALVNDEYYCGFIAGLTEAAIHDCVSGIDGIRERSADGLMKLLNALLLSGTAMSYSGNSRPASGAEHHIAHFLEMSFLFDGKIPPPHGTLVGIGALAVSKIHEMLISDLSNMTGFNLNQDASKQNAESSEYFAKELRRIYKSGAEALIREYRFAGQMDEKCRRTAVYAAKKNEIIKVIRNNSAGYQHIKKCLEAVGGETSPEKLLISKETFTDSVIYAKELRKRFTVLQIADDLNLLRRYAAEISEFFYTRK